jgi:PTS system nitrogen regulatory IIA component
VAANVSKFRIEDAMETTTQWLCPQQIELDVDAGCRREALRAVSVSIARARRLSAPPVYRALWRREMAATTAVGNGLAIPHARITGIAEPVTMYMRTRPLLNFAAPDGKRVSELYVILVPSEGATNEHLQILGMVAEAFSDRDFRCRLAGASDPQGVRSVFSQWIAESQSGAPRGLMQTAPYGFGHQGSARGRPHAVVA